MDAVAHFGAEHVVYEAMLSDPAEALERGRGNDCVEVVPVARNLCPGARNSCLNAVLQLLWRSRHKPRVASPAPIAILAEA